MFWVLIEFEKLSRDPKARAMLHVVFIELEKLSRDPSMLAVALVFAVAIAQCARARLSASAQTKSVSATCSNQTV